MKKLCLKIFMFFTLATTLIGCASMPSNEKKTVSTGSDIKLVATSVAICKILDELGYKNVVGVPETSLDLPERYKEVKTIGAPMSPDYEIIKNISPDMVLSPKSLEDTLSKEYRAAGINSAFLDLSSVEGMYKGITSLGKMLDCEDKAQELVSQYNEYIDNYKTDSSEEPNVLLLMAFPDGFYLVSTENSYVGNLVELAKGNNVYGKNYSGDENGFVNINPEDIIQKKPDKILVYAHYAEEDAFKFMKQEFESNSVWQHYEAVQNGEIYYLPSKYFGMSATLSWTDALDYLRPVLYEK